jgi:hypothetical protein
MARYIKIADTTGRDADVIITSKSKKPSVKTITASGSETQTLRVLKGSVHNSFMGLLKEMHNPESIAKAMISSDPEIDMLLTGRFIKGSSKVYINKDLKPASRISIKEIVYTPDGKIKEERIPMDLLANIHSENPLKAVKFFPKKDIYNKFVLGRKYQLNHINGLTYDFLFKLAKELHEKEAVIMIGAGSKGNEPLVFQDGGKGYRAFLEGRIAGNKYQLILHLTNLELKGI